MERQVFGPNPATGRVEHHYVDLGKGEVDRLRGSALTPRTATRIGENLGRKIVRGGGRA